MISVVIICNMKSGPLGNFSLKRLSTDRFSFFCLQGVGVGVEAHNSSLGVPFSAEFGSGLRCDGGKERSHRL